MPALDDARRAILPELNRILDDIDAWEEGTEAAVSTAPAAIKAKMEAILNERPPSLRDRIAAIEVALGGPQGQPAEPTEPAPAPEQQPA